MSRNSNIGVEHKMLGLKASGRSLYHSFYRVIWMQISIAVDISTIISFVIWNWLLVIFAPEHRNIYSSLFAVDNKMNWHFQKLPKSGHCITLLHPSSYKASKPILWLSHSASLFSMNVGLRLFGLVFSPKTTCKYCYCIQLHFDSTPDYINQSTELPLECHFASNIIRIANSNYLRNINKKK